ncbi:MAG: 3-keto-5-aminohexanoate cleavage protein [Acidobacteria bacterium]|nr:MAG: 3-keto-5-aminohexanoate cleavage protein [Acidobacteriota bacterium]
MSGAERVIVTCALTGAQQGKEANPNLPLTPAEIVAQGLEAWRAGAAILHLHARDPAGRPSADPAIFAAIVSGLREAGCDAVLNLSTGGAVAGIPLDERLAVVTELRPEIASLSAGGGVLLGRFDERRGAWAGDRFVPLFGSHAELERAARLFADCGVRPELEVYHAGQLNTVRALHARGLLAEPPLVNLVMGIPGECTGPTVRNLAFLVDQLPAGAVWLASAIGARHHFRMLGAAVAMGGQVRVGLEDNVYMARGELAASNGQVVAKAVRIIRELGFEPAAPDHARAALELEGGDG